MKFRRPLGWLIGFTTFGLGGGELLSEENSFLYSVVRWAGNLLVLLAMLAAWSTLTTAFASAQGSVDAITDLRAAYELHTGLTCTSTPTQDFGAYVVVPKDDALFIGMSAGKPGGANGGMLLIHEGGATRPVLSAAPDNPISEQGLHDMELVGDKLFIIGTDPACEGPDEWDAGTLYTYSAAEGVTKFRLDANGEPIFSKVLHMFGITTDPTNDDIWLTTTSLGRDYDPDLPYYPGGGEVFRSTDRGESWEIVASDLGSRAWDIVYWNGKLHVGSNDYTASLASSADRGVHWQRQPSAIAPNDVTRYILFDGKLVGVQGQPNPDISYLRDPAPELFTLDSAGNVETFPTSWLVADSFHVLANPGDDSLYAINDEGDLLASSDLVSWTTVYESDDDLVSLTYWEAREAFVLGTRGLDAKLIVLYHSELGTEPDISIGSTNHDYGEVSIGSNASQHFVVTNVGTEDLSVSATGLVGVDAAEFQIAEGAPFLLPPGQSRNLRVIFAPTSLGVKSATLRIASDDPDQSLLEIALTGSGVAAPGTGAVTHEETLSGGSTGAGTVTTAASLTGIRDQLYLATVASNPSKEVDGVSGLGLTWTRVDAQCGTRKPTGVEVWMAQGTPAGDGAVTASFSRTPSHAVIAVSRYSNVDAVAPIGDTVSGNLNGAEGVCGGGHRRRRRTQTNAYAFALSTSSPGSTVYVAAAMQRGPHSEGTGYTERVELVQGSDRRAASVAVQDQLIDSASRVRVDGSFGLNVDWAVVGLEIRPE